MNDDELAGVLSQFYSFSENLHYPLSLFWKPEPHPASVRSGGKGGSAQYMRLLAKKSVETTK